MPEFQLELPPHLHIWGEKDYYHPFIHRKAGATLINLLIILPPEPGALQLPEGYCNCVFAVPYIPRVIGVDKSTGQPEFEAWEEITSIKHFHSCDLYPAKEKGLVLSHPDYEQYVRTLMKKQQNAHLPAANTQTSLTLINPAGNDGIHALDNVAGDTPGHDELEEPDADGDPGIQHPLQEDPTGDRED